MFLFSFWNNTLNKYISMIYKQIKDVIYDSEANVLSVLYENKGIDIFVVSKNVDGDSKLHLSNIMKSWNGTLCTNKELMLKCIHTEDCEDNDDSNLLRITILICDGKGYLSIMSNEQKTNDILEHKGNLKINYGNGASIDCVCCLNDLINCSLFA